MNTTHVSERKTRPFIARSDLVSLLSLCALWILMSALVNPIGDFPLNDDWRYALGVRSILDAGRFELPSPEAPNVFAQAYWGALFCLPSGFSFTALRFSTLTLGAAGICALYLLIWETSGDRRTALLGGLTLAVNPLYFGLAQTFMTDVPFVALVIATLWLFVRGFRREERVSLLAGILIALITVLIRQFALLLLLAFGVAYVMKRGTTWMGFLVAIMPLAMGIGLHVFYQRWMVETGRTPFFELASFNLIPTPLGAFVTYSLRYIIIALPYLGFFIAPFLASVALLGSHPDGRNRRLLICLLVVMLTSALLVALYTVYTPVRDPAHILEPFGLGARTLRDTFQLRQNFPVIPTGMAIFWIGSIFVGALGGAAALLYLAHATVKVAKGLWRPDARAESWLEALMLVFFAAYATSMLLVGFSLHSPLFDRYLLVFVPVIFVLVVTKETPSEYMPAHRSRGALSLTLVLVYAAVNVAATHDYLAWNRARWMATAKLMDAGISPHQIDGGYEFNGWYLFQLDYHRKADKSYWWVDDDEYIIASGPIKGYRELQRFSFSAWLLLADASVVVLHRLDPGNR
jgi:4-amino-4-deoxy-L-arabinose transferase-like glycosyltransferase